MFFFRRRKSNKKSPGHLRLCPRPRNALKVEKEREVGLSRDNRGGFLHYADASVEMTFIPKRVDEEHPCKSVETTI